MKSLSGSWALVRFQALGKFRGEAVERRLSCEASARLRMIGELLSRLRGLCRSRAEVKASCERERVILPLRQTLTHNGSSPFAVDAMKIMNLSASIGDGILSRYLSNLTTTPEPMTAPVDGTALHGTKT